jgi:hypothetical protein
MADEGGDVAIPGGDFDLRVDHVVAFRSRFAPFCFSIGYDCKETGT